MATLIGAVRASEILGYSVQHTRLLIRRKILPAQKVGRDWVIEESLLESLRSKPRPTGKQSNHIEAPRP